MASSDATAIPVKNQAYRVIFPIWDADGDLVTGAAGLDSEVSKDQGTFADCTNEATEIATSSGMYYLDLTSTEMNADCVAVIVKTSTSGAKTTPLVFYPQEAGDIKVNVTYWNGTAVASPATAGIPDVNVKNMNNVAATSITTVNANQGTTQPVNYTGTGASALVKSDMVDVAGAAVSTSTAQIGVNAVNWAGGAIPSPAVTGVPKIDLAYILGTILTETSGQIAAAFKKFFDKATPTGTINSLPDAVAGATGGVFIAGTNAATTVTTALTTTFTGNLTGNVGGNVTGNVGGSVGSVGSVAAGGITAASFAANALDAVWSVATRLLTAGTNIVLAKGTGVTGFNDLSAAQVNTEADTALADVGVTTTVTGRIDATISSRSSHTAAQTATAVWDYLTSAATTVGSLGKLLVDNITGNAYTRLGAPAGASISADIAAVQADADDIQTRLPAALVSGRMDASTGAMAANVVTASALATDAVNEIADGILDRNMATGTDSSSNTVRTLRSAVRKIRNKYSISGTTGTATKEDDVTTAYTEQLTLDPSASPITGWDPS